MSTIRKFFVTQNAAPDGWPVAIALRRGHFEPCQALVVLMSLENKAYVLTLVGADGCFWS
jgi:hypothetical protein